jgi:hypothetical protein
MSNPRSVTARGVERLSCMPACKLAEDAPDVRGWEVTTPTSVHLGVVRDLLVDLALLRVCQLDILLDADPAATRSVLLPIDQVWINDALDEIVVPVSVSLDALASAGSLMDGGAEEEIEAANGVELKVVSEAAD